MAILVMNEIKCIAISLNNPITYELQVQAPVVCGISSLGYDHMDVLG